MPRAARIAGGLALLLALGAGALHAGLAWLVHSRLNTALTSAWDGGRLAHDGIGVGPFAAWARVTAPRVVMPAVAGSTPVMRAERLRLTRGVPLWRWLWDGRVTTTLTLDGVRYDTGALERQGAPAEQIALLEALSLVEGDGDIRLAVDYRPAAARLDAELRHGLPDGPHAGLIMALDDVDGRDFRALAERRMPGLTVARFEAVFDGPGTRRRTEALARVSGLATRTLLRTLILPLPQDRLRRELARRSGIRLERLALAPLLSELRLEGVSRPGADGVPGFHVDTIRLRDLALHETAGRVFPTSGRLALDRVRSRVTDWPPAVAAPLARAGHTRIEGTLDVRARLDVTSGRLSLEDLEVTLDDLGHLTAALELGGLSAGDLARRPEAALLTSDLVHARIEYTDRGLVPALMAQAPRAGWIAGVVDALEKRLGRSAPDVVDPLRVFLREAGRLTVRAAPDEPVSLRVPAVAAATGRYGSLPGLLGLSVTHSPP